VPLNNDHQQPGRGESGFIMVTMLGVMVIVLALVFTTYQTVDGDLKPGRTDIQRKVAYAAAEAGIQNYLFHLVQDDQYWARCTTVAAPNAVNQRWSGTGTDTRTRWLNVPGGDARYALELLPANGAASCVQNSQASMIDNASGTFRIRSTGQATSGGPRRAIVATFRRASFLNFIYFTDLETQDPALYSITAQGRPTRENQRAGTPKPPQRDVVQWGTETCAKTYWYKGRSAIPDFRGDPPNAGRLSTSNTWQSYSRACGEINFIGPTTATNGNNAPTASDRDVINGPLHTNDELLLCGFARFGRSPQDAIEVSGPGRTLTASESPATVGWRPNASCGSSGPNVNFTTTGTLKTKLGIWRPNAPTLTMPPTNAALREVTDPLYRFKGLTTITLNGTTMTVTGRREDGTLLTNAVVNIPSDGSIYVSHDNGPLTGTGASQHGGGCGATYNPITPNGTAAAPIPPGCGNLQIQGTYSVAVTLGAENDIIIKDDVRKSATADVLLGMISNNFIRVYHPVTNLTPNTSSSYDCDNNGGPAPNVTIDAAILSLAHSFVVDNYYCGATVGTLTIFGAIAQKFRGPVGTSNGGTPQSGFVKSYTYDDRLRFRSPPNFIDPVAAGWQVQLYTEQVPAR
jgi:Tfp pilus assembly protein PilX